MLFSSPIDSELAQVETCLRQQIHSELPLLNQMAGHLANAGGKRLRPAFFLLAAKMFRSDLHELLPLASAIEMVHMATLIHDDLIDNSKLRRGVPTVKQAYGNRMSVYTGNYLFARSLNIAAAHTDEPVLNRLAQVSMQICSGEFEQLRTAYNVEQTIASYMRRIRRKTALLIALSCEMGGFLVGAPASAVKYLRKYGHYVGLAFQISDDILDLAGEEKIIGKPIGSDIREGNFNLPVLYALQNSAKKERLQVLLSDPQACERNIKEIIRIVYHAQGIEFAHYVAQRFAERALSALDDLPAGEVRASLARIAQEIPRRRY